MLKTKVRFLITNWLMLIQLQNYGRLPATRYRGY